jgi:Zn-dependent peptidase ImmA (M78 family)/transcriptional regulator with XRE-family HTH domain
MTTAAAHIRPEVLRWARESSGYTVAEVARELKVFAYELEAAEHGDDLLTLSQAEHVAELYERPLAALFLPEPPDEETAESLFRRLPGAPTLPWPPAMNALARRTRQRQAAVAEIYEDLDEQPPWRATVGGLNSGITPSMVRSLLDVPRSEQVAWRDTSGYRPLRHWIDAVESLGVLVMQDGSMSTDVMRGFASPHDSVPAVVINNHDDPRSRVFSLLHEFGHLLVAALDISYGGDLERWCNQLASDVLMPPALVSQVVTVTAGTPPTRHIKSVALRLGVTPHAAAVRVRQLDLMPRQLVEQVIADLRAEHTVWQPTGDGGDYYRTEISRLGPSYVRTVFLALESEAIDYRTASDLLGGVKIKNFTKLQGYLDRRAHDE